MMGCFLSNVSAGHLDDTTWAIQWHVMFIFLFICLPWSLWAALRGILFICETPEWLYVLQKSNWKEIHITWSVFNWFCYTFHRNTVFLSIAYRSCTLIWIVHLHFMYYLMEHLFFICFVRALSLEASAALRSLPNLWQRRVKLPLHV